MKKSHMENRETVSQGFFESNKLNKTCLLGGSKTIDTGNRFASLSGTPGVSRDATDPGMRVNVSQRRWVHRGQSLEASKSFEERKAGLQNGLALKGALRNDGAGEKILERKLQISRDADAYYLNDKVYSNLRKVAGGSLASNDPRIKETALRASGAEVLRYQQNVPSYFRIMDDPKYRNVVHKQANGEPATMVSVVSKTQGWITVSPTAQDRKRPIEKERLGDASKVNALSPAWMQVSHKKPGPDPLGSTAVKHGVRAEANRTFLVEKSQPQRSIFNLGAFRHNVHSVAQRDECQRAAIASGAVTEQPVRLIEWNEPNRDRQSFDKHVSAKIGSSHFR